MARPPHKARRRSTLAGEAGGMAWPPHKARRRSTLAGEAGGMARPPLMARWRGMLASAGEGLVPPFLRGIGGDRARSLIAERAAVQMCPGFTLLLLCCLLLFALLICASSFTPRLARLFPSFFFL